MNAIQIYSTPFWESPFPDFEQDQSNFIESVQKFRSEYPDGVKTSNIGDAYQSPMILTREQSLSRVFDFAIQMGMKAAFDLQLVDCDVHMTAAWVNFCDTPGAMLYEHIHQDTFHGIFYLQVPKDSGKLVLTNPAINPLWQGQMLCDKKNKFTADRMKITPKEGTIFLFPSYVPHGVEPSNQEDIERISIGFNLICIPKEYVNHTK